MEQSSDILDEKTLLQINNNNNLSNINMELCLVCGDRASGRHYGAISCEGCKGFFKRSIRKKLGYQCRGRMDCEVTKHHRNRCQYCRLQKCLACGMRSDSVQHERKPIVDKKETSTTTSCLTATHNSTGLGINNSSTSSSGVASSACVGAISAAVVNNTHNNKFTRKSYDNNSAAYLNMFPVGFNLAEFASSLEKRSNTTPNLLVNNLPIKIENDIHLENTNIHMPSSLAALSSITSAVAASAPSLSSASSSSSSNHNKNQSTNFINVGYPIAAGTIESAIEKNQINLSLDLLNSLQYDITLINSNNNNNNNKNENNSSNSSSIKIEPNNTEYDNNLNIDDFECPILNEQNINFELLMPNLLPTYLGVHYVCETSSRLLFLTINWTKKLYLFNILSDDIQIVLLKRSWSDLFLLGLSQCCQTMSFNTIVLSLINYIKTIIRQNKWPSRKIKRICDHIIMIHEFVIDLNRLGLDEYEFGFLKIISLFNGDNIFQDILRRQQINQLQELSCRNFKNYVINKTNINENSDTNESTNRTTNDRYTKLLLKMTTLRAFDSEIVEELFFSNLIGQVQIDNVIPFILNIGSNSDDGTNSNQNDSD